MAGVRRQLHENLELLREGVVERRAAGPLYSGKEPGRVQKPAPPAAACTRPVLNHPRPRGARGCAHGRPPGFPEAASVSPAPPLTRKGRVQSGNTACLVAGPCARHPAPGLWCCAPPALLVCA